MPYELIGYAASVLVALSLMMSSILRLRIINLVGSTLFAIYGVLIDAWPVAIVNAFITCINIFYLVRIYGAKEYFCILDVRRDSEYLRYFIDYNRTDIATYQPTFDGIQPHYDLIFFVLRDVVPAGLFVGQLSQGTLFVALDYVQPDYRDFKIGEFIFRQQAEFFRERGISRIVSAPGTPRHVAYLRRMGFEARADGTYERTIA
jgi:GNAT superfamily N-acetyltransferase